jgi:hypothetical protein
VRDVHRTKINGRAYAAPLLPAGKGIRILTRVTKLAGASLGNVTSVREALEKGGEVIRGFAERLDDAEVESILRDFAEVTEVEHSPGTGNMVPLKNCFDLHFAGNYLELIEWAAWSFKVNFGPLVSALGARFARAPAASPDAAP